jgi:yeast amino acid transporter
MKPMLTLIQFVDPALGFSLGYTYWFKYIIVTPNQLTAAALVIQYWLPPEQVNPGVFIAVFLVTIITINYLGIKFFGEIEFWLSSIKVLVILGLILLSIIIAAGGVPGHAATGFRYYNDPGAFNTYKGDGALGRFTAFWYSFTNAVFAYLGTELVGVTVGEAENPRRNIPRAIKLTFWRILLFYICSVFLLCMIVPYDSQLLAFATDASTGAAASPFVVAIKLAGIETLPGFLNGCILIFVRFFLTFTSPSAITKPQYRSSVLQTAICILHLEPSTAWPSNDKLLHSWLLQTSAESHIIPLVSRLSLLASRS